MIPVAPQPEPRDFNKKVRRPGQAFLARNPNPAKREDWKGKEFWRACLDDLATAYNRICAYSSQWISTCDGFRSVDHFLPICADRDLAYEWSNFRFASGRMNARKGNYRDVLDPFAIKAETFELDFLTLQVIAGRNLPRRLRAEADATIARLKLNDNISVEGRTEWLLPYCEREITLGFLRKRAPFIAYEIKRQGLSAADVRKMFRHPKSASS